MALKKLMGYYSLNSKNTLLHYPGARHHFPRVHFCLASILCQQLLVYSGVGVSNITQMFPWLLKCDKTALQTLSDLLQTALRADHVQPEQTNFSLTASSQECVVT